MRSFLSLLPYSFLSGVHINPFSSSNFIISHSNTSPETSFQFQPSEKPSRNTVKNDHQKRTLSRTVEFPWSSSVIKTILVSPSLISSSMVTDSTL